MPHCQLPKGPNTRLPDLEVRTQYNASCLGMLLGPAVMVAALVCWPRSMNAYHQHGTVTPTMGTLVALGRLLALPVMALLGLVIWGWPAWKRSRVSIRDETGEILRFYLTSDADGDSLAACWLPDGRGFLIRAIGDIRTEILLIGMSGDLSDLQGRTFRLHRSRIPHLQARIVLWDGAIQNRRVMNAPRTWAANTDLLTAIARAEGPDYGVLCLGEGKWSNLSSLVPPPLGGSRSGARGPTRSLHTVIEERPVSEADGRAGLVRDRVFRSEGRREGDTVAERPLRFLEFRFSRPPVSRFGRALASLSSATNSNDPYRTVSVATDNLELRPGLVAALFGPPTADET